MNHQSKGQIAVLAMFISVAALLFANVAQANQFKRIRDVNVSCNNALLCDLYITNPRVSLYSFGFRRAAGPDAPVRLILSTRDPFRAGSDITFLVDGEEVFSQATGAFNYRAAVYEYSYRDQDNIALLLDAARRGAELQVTYVTRAGQSTVPFSLSGMIAGSIFMDEVQGRVGRADSILVLGEKSARPAETGSSSSAAVEPIDDAGDLPSSIAIAFSDPDGRCFDAFAARRGRGLGGFKTNIVNDVYLYGMPCGTGGAYNQSFAFWVQFGNFVSPLALPSMGETGPIAMMTAFNTVYDADKRELTSFYKFRGLGDCGVFHRWSVSEQDYTSLFRLEELTAKSDCDGSYKEDNSDYTQIWPPE